MLEELVHSGLPLFLDGDTNQLVFTAPLAFAGSARKTGKQMTGLLYNESAADPEEPYYDVYRDICFPKDKEVFAKYRYRYDITVIMPGQVGGECKKTSGHYHGYNSAGINTYPEVYEVLKGRAIYLLQRANSFDSNPEKLNIDDVILAEVNEGQTILIPPNYGHCSVNAGDGPLIFSNLAYEPCPILYEPVKRYGGMSCYILRENGETRVNPNPRYQKVPQPKYAAVTENPHLGVRFGWPVYESFCKNPEAFWFLGSVDGYEEEIMAMLKYR